jgi:hypothetical protein
MRGYEAIRPIVGEQKSDREYAREVKQDLQLDRYDVKILADVQPRPYLVRVTD